MLIKPRLLWAFAISLVFFVALVLPRAAESRFVPLPVVDHARLAEIDRIERKRFSLGTEEDGSRSTAQGAQMTELSVGVRTVGELFRRSGALLAEAPSSAQAALHEMRAQFELELARGRVSELLALRSLQTELFVRALKATPTADRARELRELGGDLDRYLQEGWLGWDGDGDSVDEVSLRLLFRVRWGLLVGCHRRVPFGPSLEELRAYYSIYLRHPPLAPDGDAAMALERVRYARALGRIDPEYPLDFALGSLLLQAHEPELAAPHLRAHLARSEDGRYAWLARSYLLYATSRE